MYSLLTATAERAQGGEQYLTATIETGSGIGYESSQKHLLCILLPYKLEKHQKLFGKEQEHVFNLKLLWVGESPFPGTSGQMDGIAITSLLPHRPAGPREGWVRNTRSHRAKCCCSCNPLCSRLSLGSQYTCLSSGMSWHQLSSISEQLCGEFGRLSACAHALWAFPSSVAFNHVLRISWMFNAKFVLRSTKSQKLNWAVRGFILLLYLTVTQKMQILQKQSSYSYFIYKAWVYLCLFV